ncbi:hypothetical protein GOV14_04130 [Candidatus Pacearchaeota archaeon]|nr:hypothetical protein [Candidatus Pacearchaeota archaeon]
MANSTETGGLAEVVDDTEMSETDVDARRLHALSHQDASTYRILCDDLGLEPEDSALYAQGGVNSRDASYIEQGTEILMAERKVEEKLEARRSRARNSEHFWRGTYKHMLDAAFSAKVSTEKSKDTNVKRGHLRTIMGYTRLMCNGSQKGDPASMVPLDSAHPDRVGAVYQGIIRRAKLAHDLPVDF